MIRIKNLILSLSFMFAIFKASYALDLGFAKEDAGHAGVFLDFAASARSLGMGRAHVGIADDASAVYWNPSGLAQLDRKDVVAMYSALYEDSGFGSINYAHPTVGMGTFGFGFVNLQSSNFDQRDSVGSKQGRFGTSATGLLISNGFHLNPTFAMGATLKMVNEQVASFSDTGYGMDLGGLWTGSSRLQAGFTLRNLLAPKINLRKVSDEYPRTILVGAKYQALRKLTLAMDLNKTAERSTKIHFGGEWANSSNLAFRFGINETEVTAGLGIKVGALGLDYAFGFQDAVGGVKDLGSSHRIGFHFSFGQKASDQEASLRWQKKGQVYLLDLKAKMNQPYALMDDELQEILAGTHHVIRQQGYIKPQDLYMAQGYVSYFEGEYERSVQSLGEAYNLDSSDEELARHLDKARAQMKEERTREIVFLELKKVKELFGKSDWKGTVKSCEKILSFRPRHPEALVYLEDAKTRIAEPIMREMKIGQMHLEREEFLDAMKSFQKVKEMDPEHKEAADLMTKAIAALEKQAQTQIAIEPSTGERPVYELSKSPEKSRQLYSQGLLLYSQGKLKDASVVWLEAVKLDETNALARNAYNRAQLELQEKRP